MAISIVVLLPFQAIIMLAEYNNSKYKCNGNCSHKKFLHHLRRQIPAGGKNYNSFSRRDSQCCCNINSSPPILTAKAITETTLHKRILQIPTHLPIITQYHLLITTSLTFVLPIFTVESAPIPVDVSTSHNGRDWVILSLSHPSLLPV